MKGATPDSGVEQAEPSTGSTPENRLAFSDGLGGRKQMEVLEDWVKSQLARQQQQSELLMERSLRRMEARMQAMENEQPKLEMSVAKLGGGLKGLADEFASQALRIDALETRQWEWRQSVEESLRARLAELERQLKNCATNVFKQCVANEEGLYREAARLQALEERTGGSDLGATRMVELEDQVAAMRLQVERLDQVVQAFDPSRVAASEDAQWEQRAAGVVAKIDPLMKELSNVHARVQEQEMKLGTFRVNLSSQEKRTLSLIERLETIDSEGHLKHLQDSAAEDMLKDPIAPKTLFEDRPASAMHAAAVQVRAEQWLHTNDNPVRNLGLLSSSGNATPASEGKRELLGLCETMRVDEDSEEDEGQ